jgi:hypothetical protein
MAGRAYSPRFLWMWPNARVSVMGGDQLQDVMQTISNDPSKTSKLKAQIEHQSTPLYASARLWDDGVIAPSDTRAVLGMGLSVAMKSWDPERRERGNFGVFRMVSPCHYVLDWRLTSRGFTVRRCRSWKGTRVETAEICNSIHLSILRQVG